MKKLILSAIGVAIVSAAPANAGYIDKGDYDVWVKAAKIYEQGLDAENRGVSAEAIVKYNQAIKLFPYDPSFFNNLSRCYIAQQKLALAELNTRKALALTPDDPRYQLNLAKILAAEDKIPEAVAIADKINCGKDAKLRQKLYKFRGDMTLIQNHLRI